MSIFAVILHLLQAILMQVDDEERQQLFFSTNFLQKFRFVYIIYLYSLLYTGRGYLYSLLSSIRALKKFLWALSPCVAYGHLSHLLVLLILEWIGSRPFAVARIIKTIPKLEFLNFYLLTLLYKTIIYTLNCFLYTIHIKESLPPKTYLDFQKHLLRKLKFSDLR